MILAIETSIKDLGFAVSEEALVAIVAKVKELGDKKKEILDDELSAIADEYLEETNQVNRYKLDYVAVTAGTEIPTATVRLIKIGGKGGKASEEFTASLSGDGPVDAALRAIDKITGIDGKLLDYGIRSVSKGKDAIGEVRVKINFRDQIITGKGASTDVIEASILAYLDALNRFLQLNPKNKALLKESL